MTRRRVFIAVIAGLLLAAAILVYGRAGGHREPGLSDSQLIARIDTFDPDEQLRIISELAKRGPQALPAILDAFHKNQVAETRLALADAVYRMPASAQTGAAFEQMKQEARGTPIEERMARMARDRAGGGRR